MSTATIDIEEAQSPEKERPQDELESIEQALAELNMRYAANALAQSCLFSRIEQLRSRAQALRRKHARHSLDAALPPITFHSIEVEGESERHQVFPTFAIRKFLAAPVITTPLEYYERPDTVSGSFPTAWSGND